MAVAETARLIASLELQDKNFTRGISKVEKGVDRVDKKLGAFSGFVNRNVGRAIDSVAVRLISSVGTGLEELAQLEDATTSVTGAINQMGLQGKVTAQQIADWANEIEGATEAAFDDKAITQATTTLIRYGRVTENNIRPAMEVITDLAARTGDVESAAKQLAKALADPTKAAGALRKNGVLLTKEQQKLIKTMVEAGDVAGAQALVLDAVAESTKGAAKASAGPYRDALNKLADTGEDVRRALAIGFLPVIEEVANVLTTELGKKETLTTLKSIGTSLAGTLRSLIGMARQLPWGAIGDSLKIAGTGAKFLLDAFLGMPPWVQTAVLTGWGLNKLTGGAVTSAIGSLIGAGIGKIKGVLGIQAGVVNVTGGVVNGPGGVPGAGAVAAGGLKSQIAGLLRMVLPVAIPIAFAAVVAEVARGANAATGEQARALGGQQKVFLAQSPALSELKSGLDAIDRGIADIENLPLGGILHSEALAELKSMREIQARQIAALEGIRDQRKDEQTTGQTEALNDVGLQVQREGERTQGATNEVKAAVSQGLIDHRAGERGDLTLLGSRTTQGLTLAQNVIRGSVDAGKVAVTGSVNAASAGIQAAIRSIPAPITNVIVNITPTKVTTATTKQERSGPGSGSRNHGTPGPEIV